MQNHPYYIRPTKTKAGYEPVAFFLISYSKNKNGWHVSQTFQADMRLHLKLLCAGCFRN